MKCLRENSKWLYTLAIKAVCFGLMTFDLGQKRIIVSYNYTLTEFPNSLHVLQCYSRYSNGCN